MQISLPDDRTIELTQGDITEQQADAIVNAANSALLPGGGVCGAIHRAGGPSIAQECARIRAERGEVSPGHAVATGGGRLRARHVIHAVGPVWSGGHQGETETLASCYRESIALADRMELSSIAFPSISTGIFGYPVEKAAPVALAAVREALGQAQSVKLARFVLFDSATMSAYEQAGKIAVDVDKH